LQIISEQEVDEDQSVLTNSVLKQLIRFYGSNMQVFIRPYLEKSLTMFIDRQESIQGFVDKMAHSKSFDSFSQIIEEGMEKWTRFTFGDYLKKGDNVKKKDKE
jgi:polyhydroxyalkanoate synthesis regulator protein